MSCDHQLIAEHICDYIEGNLPPALAAGCSAALQHCAHCSGVHARALEFCQLASGWQEQPVPDWPRARPALQPPGTQAQRWPAFAALATSLCVAALVLLQVEVSTANGLWISFGGQQTDARVRAVLDAELARYTATRDGVLEARLAEFTASQSIANELLFARWQEENRDERREELGFLMSGWQAQRYEDYQALNTQLGRLSSGQRETSQYLNALLQTVANDRRNDL